MNSRVSPARAPGVLVFEINLDMENHITGVGGEWPERFGRDTQVVGRPFGEWVKLPADIPFAALRRRAINGGFRFSADVVDAAGTKLRFESVAREVGETLNVQMLHDPRAFTDALVEEMVAKDGEFRRALSLVHVGYWAWHPQSNQLTWSDEIFRLMGVGKDTVPGMESFVGAMHPDDREAVQKNIMAVMQVGQAPDMEYRFVHQDGNVVVARTRAQLIKDDAGNVLYLFGTIQDVTQQKEYEAGLERAKRAAEQANLAKTQFLSRVNHEFRTPLNAVLGNAELLRMEVSEQQQPFANDLVDACKQLEVMLSNALDITAIDQLTIKAAPVDVSTLVRELPSQVQALSTRHNVHVHIDPSATAPHFVHSDAQRIRQILQQLVSNAIKYSHSGGDVRVMLEQAGEKLMVRVRDRGVGIARGDLKRIFMPFERVGGRENILPGTGLGLTLSNELAKLLGGSIDVESTPGEGSCFTLSLPL